MKAIILAAGMGTRLRPLTNDTPKSLVKVNGEPLAERQIKFLKEKGIEDIIVVTGYLNEKFEYLKDKYGVKLIHNDKYDIYNNIYTMYLVREHLQDAYVTEADVYMAYNYFDPEINRSTYFTAIKSNFENEWILKADEKGRVNDIVIGNGTNYIMSGVSFWSKKDGLFIKERLERIVESGDFKDLFWDNIVLDNLANLDVYIKKLDSNSCFEIDSIEDLNKLNKYVTSL